MTRTIKTILERVTTLKKALVAIGMVATVGAGIVAEDRFVVDVELNSGMYTGYEYRQIRQQLGLEAFLLEENEEWNINKFLDYVAILNIEATECGALYSVQSKADIRGMLKKFDTQGCPTLPIQIR